MNTTEFLTGLSRKGIQLWVENGELCFRAPKGTLTPELRTELSACKAEIIVWLAPLGKIASTSFSQERLWFLDQLEPGSTVYNIPIAYRLRGRLDVNALEWSLQTIVERHDTLRTHFATLAGQPVQVIKPPSKIELHIIDLTSLNSLHREAVAQEQLDAAAKYYFELDHGSLFCFSLWCLDSEEHILLLNFHHIISDGWSLDVFHRELQVLYEARLAGKPSPLPPLAKQYSDFAVWQRQWLQGDVLDKQLAYWKQQLDGSPMVLELPTDRPRPAVQTSRGTTMSFVLPVALSKALQALSQRESVTLYMTLLAAFQVLLHRYTAQTDIVVGAPIANRNQTETEGLIGLLVNTLALRCDLSGNPSFRKLLGRVREMALGAYSHQDLPFEKLVEELQPRRSLAHSPIFQVMFELQNLPDCRFELPGLKLEAIQLAGNVARFDLSLVFLEQNGDLVGHVEYSTDLFDAGTIERMIGHYQTLLENIIVDPNRTLSTLLLTIPIEARRFSGSTPRPQPESALPYEKDSQAMRKAVLEERRAKLSSDKQAMLEKRLRGQ